VTVSLDLDRLSRAREMAARLTDAELAKELRNDRSAIRPEAWRALEEEAQRRAKPKRTPILTTTATLNQPIRRVLGIVGSEYVLGVNLFQEFLAGLRDTVGGRSATIQGALREARETLLRELSANAAALHADAVVSIAFTLSEWSGQNKSMLILLASGTAVELSADRPDA
jgi:uncharacterized protein YbjQ (UPF0145 family)